MTLRDCQRCACPPAGVTARLPGAVIDSGWPCPRTGPWAVAARAPCTYSRARHAGIGFGETGAAVTHRRACSPRSNTNSEAARFQPVARPESSNPDSANPRHTSLGTGGKQAFATGAGKSGSYRVQVADGTGAGHLESLVLQDTASGVRRSVPADASFVLVGSQPRTERLGEGVARDRQGFILTGPDVLGDTSARWLPGRSPLPLETSLPGVFAAGDVRHGSVKRVASAVGEGAATIPLVHRYLETMTAARVRHGSTAPKTTASGR